MKQQKDIMKGLEPARVWHWFGEIMQIPRPSKHEERISAWLVQWGKDHGLENLIEGDIKPGQKVVLIEDQLSTGNNCMKCYNTVSDAGGIVLGAVVIYDYQFPMAAKALKRAKLPIITLTNFETMIDVALEGGTINQADADTLQQWHGDPENWVAAGFDAVD